jgi:adenine deaminase
MKIVAWTADIDKRCFIKKELTLKNDRIEDIKECSDSEKTLSFDQLSKKGCQLKIEGPGSKEINELLSGFKDRPAVLIPAFVDSHIHIESSMLTPDEFSRKAVCHGTGALVADPHEIVNVAGIEGLNYMMRSAEKSPIEIVFGVPSCVPACRLDTSGYELTEKDTDNLLKRRDTAFLGEVMDFVSVINGDEQVLSKIEAAKRYNKPIDGHCPGLSGKDLEKYVSSGISTDHESSSVQEAVEKINLGMFIQIRNGSAARDYENLWTLVRDYPEKCMLCSDDLHPDDLEKGHIDLMVRDLLEKGVDFFNVIAAASVNPINHYSINTGLLKKGDPADFVLFDPVDKICLATFVKGRAAGLENKALMDYSEPESFTTITLKRFAKKDFVIPHQQSCINVIRIKEGSLLTKRMKVRPNIIDGNAVSDTRRDILRLSVISRYSSEQSAHAFVNGLGLKSGAIASSVCHDSHNIIVAGADEEDMAHACNLLFENKGGLVWYDRGESLVLPLKIGGLISGLSCEETADLYLQLNRAVAKSGSDLRAPFMTLSFLGLPVIPDLKLTLSGLFHVTENKYRPLFEKC